MPHVLRFFGAVEEGEVDDAPNIAEAFQEHRLFWRWLAFQHVVVPTGTVNGQYAWPMGLEPRQKQPV
jgi:hypothetical protein